MPLSAMSLQPPQNPARSSHKKRISSLPPRSSNSDTPPLPKHTFRQKVESANPTSIFICTSTSRRVGRRTIRQLLSNNDDAYSVPIFQRRYCWTENQWETLWGDVLKSKRGVHSLGRLTCTDIVASDNQTHDDNVERAACVSNRSIIIDGQQRFTTVTLLLASIRDALIDIRGHDSQKEQLIQTIHQMLFLNSSDMEELMAKTNDKVTLDEGVVLDFCRLIPTYCDRSAYFAAILPPRSYAAQHFLETTYNRHWHRPILAKNYFSNQLQSQLAPHSSADAQINLLQNLLHCLLDRIDILFFPITISNHKDGSTNTQIIYERLAIRDATWCKPHRISEYHSMDGSDMIRNLLLGSFCSEVETIKFYERYWLPLERLSYQQSIGGAKELDSENEYNSVHDVIQSFLILQHSRVEKEEQEQLEQPEAMKSASKVIGGKLYCDFEAWMTFDYHKWMKERQHEGPKTAEGHTMSVGRRLLDFAEDVPKYLAKININPQ